MFLKCTFLEKGAECCSAGSGCGASGTATSGSTVQIVVDSNNVGTVQANENGHFRQNELK